MILITPDDFSRLSPSCQQELLMVFTSSGQTSPVGVSENDLTGFDGDGHGDGAKPSPNSVGEVLAATPEMGAAKNPRISEKKIVQISVDQARQLIANISPLSQKTLRLFVYGEWITVDSLIGPGKDYPNMTALRKSLVGGIVRRLRTVTGNRNAVLFASNPDKSSMKIGHHSAAALREAFNLPEPQPHSDFYHHSNGYQGEEMPPESNAPL